MGLRGGALNWGAGECFYICQAPCVVFVILYVWKLLYKSNLIWFESFDLMGDTVVQWFGTVTSRQEGLKTAGIGSSTLCDPECRRSSDNRWMDGCMDGRICEIDSFISRWVFVLVQLYCVSALSDAWEVHNSVGAPGVVRTTRFHLRLCGVTQLQFIWTGAWTRKKRCRSAETDLQHKRARIWCNVLIRGNFTRLDSANLLEELKVPLW